MPILHSHFLNDSYILIPGSLLGECFGRTDQCCVFGGVCELKDYTSTYLFIYYTAMYVSIHYAGVT